MGSRGDQTSTAGEPVVNLQNGDVSKLEWINLLNELEAQSGPPLESGWAKFKTKFVEQPLVPLGMLG